MMGSCILADSTIPYASAYLLPTSVYNVHVDVKLCSWLHCHVHPTCACTAACRCVNRTYRWIRPRLRKPTAAFPCACQYICTHVSGSKYATGCSTVCSTHRTCHNISEGHVLWVLAILCMCIAGCRKINIAGCRDVHCRMSQNCIAGCRNVHCRVSRFKHWKIYRWLGMSPARTYHVQLAAAPHQSPRHTPTNIICPTRAAMSSMALIGGHG